VGNYKCDEWAQTGRQNEKYPKTAKKVGVEKTKSSKKIIFVRNRTQRCATIVKKCNRTKRVVKFKVCVRALENWTSG
jgi:hypothetical protein